jgi:hypothetical protein
MLSPMSRIYNRKHHMNTSGDHAVALLCIEGMG